MIKKILISLLLGVIWTPRFLVSEHICCDITAPIALLINAETGKVLFSRKAEDPLYPASTTKIATALYALHKKGTSVDEVVTASYDCVAAVPSNIRRSSGKHPSYRLEFGGTSMSLKAGEEVDLKTLLYGLMLPSGNDAGNVIAKAVSGSVPQFVTELNQFLKEMGCQNTHFKNPHGLPDLEHVTTAKDLARMGQVAMKHPLFKEIVSSSKYIKAQTNKQPEVILSQHNALVKPTSKYFYPYATGIKIGYTMQAGHTIVASAEKGDRSLIAVVSHKESSEMRYRNTIQLFEAAFKEPKQIRTLFSSIHDSFSHAVEGGQEMLKAALAEDVQVSFYPSEEPNYSSQICWNSHDLPIEKGSVVGEILIFDDRDVLQKTSLLFAVKEVEPTFAYKAKKFTKECRVFFQKHRIHLAYLMAFGLFGVAVWKVARKKRKA